MAESIRTLFNQELFDLVKPYIEEGHIGDVFYILMSVATRLNIEGAQLLDYVEEKSSFKSDTESKDGVS